MCPGAAPIADWWTGPIGRRRNEGAATIFSAALSAALPASIFPQQAGSEAGP